VIHLDTHVTLWLYLEQTNRIPRTVRDLIETDDVVASPMVQLELGYLNEINRLVRTPAEVITSLAGGIGLTLSVAPFSAVVAQAMELTWTHDPFDRLIVASALADGAQLVTADRLIRANCPQAVWD